MYLGHLLCPTHEVKLEILNVGRMVPQYFAILESEYNDMEDL